MRSKKPPTGLELQGWTKARAHSLQAFRLDLPFTCPTILCAFPAQVPPMQCPTPGYFSAPIHNGHSTQHTVALGEYLLSGKTAKCLANTTKEVKAVGAEVIIQWLKHLGGQSSDTQKPNAGWVWWPAYHPQPWRQRQDPHHTLATSASCGFD